MNKILRFYFIQTLIILGPSICNNLRLGGDFFMHKNILNMTLILLALLIGFSNVHAKHKDRLIDKFIAEFVKSKNSQKIEYDGKTLTIYACASQQAYVILFVFTFFLGLLELASLVSGDKEVILLGIAIAVMFGPLLGIALCYNLYLDINKVLAISINDKEVTSSDLRYFKWKNVYKVNVFETWYNNEPYITHIHLCDKFLNPIFKMSLDSARLPVSGDNLSVLLGHYLKKCQLLADKNSSSEKVIS